jgi:hypothetical protein
MTGTETSHLSSVDIENAMQDVFSNPKKISTFRSPRDIILPEKSNAEINIHKNHHT